MQITLTPDQGPITILVMHLHGELDGGNYTELIAGAEKL